MNNKNNLHILRIIIGLGKLKNIQKATWQIEFE